MSALPTFDLPDRLEAHEPPEQRGLARDEVRMMVARRSDGRLCHARARDLPDFLNPGDVAVVNTSATIPAALLARRTDGLELDLHLSTPLPGGPEGHWVVELRHGARRFRAARAGESLSLPVGGRAELAAPYLAGSRLWVARLELPVALMDYLSRYGGPIRYRHVRGARTLADYQTAYATEPGSAEMPSAGRPLTAQVIAALAARGIAVAPVVLHTGVSSLELGEHPYSERYRVPASTARLVDAIRRWGGRVVTVGTTVVRAYETVASPSGTVHAGDGWTSLVITPERGVHAVDALLTGWHDPDASHLDLLEAVGGRELVARSYREALAQGYLWHEFGDAHLIVP